MGEEGLGVGTRGCQVSLWGGGVMSGGVLVLAVLILNHPGLTLADHAPMLNCHLSHNAGNFSGI